MSKAKETWSAYHKQQKRRRDQRQEQDEQILQNAASTGQIHIQEFARGHWRVSSADEERHLDYYSRTGTLVRQGKRLPDQGLQSVFRLLGIAFPPSPPRTTP